MMLQTLFKELRLLSRDLHGIAVLFIMPMLFMLIMSIALSDADNVNADLKIALVGSDENTLNTAFEQALIQDDKLNIVRLEPKALDEALTALHQGTYKMIIVNPNVKQETLEKDEEITLHILASTDKSWLLGIKGLIQKSYTSQRIKHYFSEFSSVPETQQNAEKVTPVTPSPQKPLNAQQKKLHAEQQALQQQQLAAMPPQPDLKGLNAYLEKDPLKTIYLNIEGDAVKQPSSVQQSVPAWLIFGMFFIMIPLSNVMAAEKQTNTIIRLRLAKTSTAALLLSKLLPYFVINQLQFVGMIVLGMYVLPLFGMPGFELQGAYYNYALLSVAISLSALGYGLLISVLAKSTEHAVVLGGGGNIIMAAIGGIMVPSYVMPESMQLVAKLSPMSWALSAFHDLLLNQYRFEQILTQWFYLIGFASLFLISAYIIYDRQLKKV